MIMPTIHLNGSGRENLENQVREAGEAIHAALEKMAAAAPHGRDYYPQDEGAITGPAYKQAEKEHLARMEKVREVLKEYEQLYEWVSYGYQQNNG